MPQGVSLKTFKGKKKKIDLKTFKGKKKKMKLIPTPRAGAKDAVKETKKKKKK